MLPSCRRMYAEKRARAVSESWTSARHLTKSKIWLTRFISAESPVVRKASIGSIVSKKSTAFCPTSKYRLIRIIANSNAPPSLAVSAALAIYRCNTQHIARWKKSIRTVLPQRPPGSSVSAPTTKVVAVKMVWYLHTSMLSLIVHAIY